MNAAILFEPDGYLMNGPKLMGRQAAGDGFLRAAVKGRGDDPLVAYTASAKSAEAFRDRVAELDPGAVCKWIPARRLHLITERGVLYRPDHAIGVSARARLRVGSAAYAICGVTHTLATSGAMDLMGDLALAPVMPWDAVVCTSSVAVELMRNGIEAQAEYLTWRLGPHATPPRPMLPQIPLGVHCEDFDFSDADRAEARTALALEPDEVTALFAGRLSFNGKAHPFPMYRALQAIREETGRPIALVHAGQFFNSAIERAYREAVALHCPDVRCIFLDGKDAAAYRRSWAAADLFVSLSDSIQETFGITPVEAMASGLPVLVSDWNGYKDTVRDGIDGFRVPTWQPAPGAGETAAWDYEVEVSDYDQFLSRASTAVAMEPQALRAAVRNLVTNEDLRRKMGAAGRTRARELFDWQVIWRQYQALWVEQNDMRSRAVEISPELLAEAPRHAPGRPDPFTAFAHYPTRWVEASTLVSLAPGADVARYEQLTAQPLLSFWKVAPNALALIFGALEPGPIPTGELASVTGLPLADILEVTGRLAKMELLELRQAAG